MRRRHPMSTNLARIVVAMTLVASASGCATTYSPTPFDIPAGAIRSDGLGGDVAIEVRAVFLEGRQHELAGGVVTIPEEQVATAIGERLTAQLEAAGIDVVAESDRRLLVEVVRTAIHQAPAFECVIDYSRSLGAGPPRGLQSRSQNWNFEVACSGAISQVVIDLLGETKTRAYLGTTLNGSE